MLYITVNFSVRRVWRYQRGNQNLHIEEEQITRWPNEVVQRDKQRSIKHTHKTKDRVTRTPLKARGDLRCFEMVNSSCSTSGTPRVHLLTNPVITHEKSLKIPKGQSDSVYRRRTDNTMAKKKSTKGQTTIYKTYIYN